MNIIFIGAPGSGKGTQAAMLSQALSVRHISSGDLFRRAFEEKTQLGLQAQKYIDLGELVPDPVTVAMMLQCIEEPASTRGVVLDGFPRTLVQAQSLDAELQRIGRQIDAAVYFQMRWENLLERFTGRLFCHAHQHVYHTEFRPPKVSGVCDLDGSKLCQRSDDKGEALRKRLAIFFNETIQLLDYYRKQHKLLEVNAEQSIEQVQKALLSEIDSLMGKEMQLS